MNHLNYNRGLQQAFRRIFVTDKIYENEDFSLMQWPFRHFVSDREAGNIQNVKIFEFENPDLQHRLLCQW